MKIDNKFIAKTGEFIVSNKKPLLYIGGAIGIVVIGYAVVSRLNKGIGTFFSDKSTGATIFTPIKIDVSKATISDELANTYANQLFNAMANSGTNNTLIGSIFEKIGKKEDFLKVYNAFGRKSYVGSLVGGSPNRLDKMLGNYDELDLVEWLDNEIGNSNPMLWATIKKTVNNAGLSL
jgi:hypothetical protein